MNKKRPVNLALTTLRFPPMAMVSIGHRISGILLFIFLPFLIYLLHESLISADSFAATHVLLGHPGVRCLLWVIGAATLFHLVAGIRHLLMDFGFGESLNAGRKSAYAVFILSAILSVFLGVWLW